MREAHCHIAAYGAALEIPDLSDCSSLAECLERVRAAAADAKSGTWVRLAGARVEGWSEARWPSVEELDRTCPEHACVLMSFDHHAAAANTRALAAAELRAGDLVAPHGVVCADPHTGRPTGLLLEHAAYRVWGCAPEPTADERLEQVQAALRRYAAMGFTEVHDLHSQDWLGPVLGTLERAGALSTDVWLYPPVARLRDVHAGRSAWESARVRLAGGKLFADGTLNSRTALMLAPYREPLDGPGGGSHGKAMVTDRDLDEAIETTAALGLHLAVHAIGDGAVRMVLNAWERWCREQRAPTHGGIGASRSEPAMRIEHCEIIDERDVPRFAELGVTCSVQPCHLLTDIDVLQRQLPHRLERVLPLRELIESGLMPGRDLWFGSDAPIVRPNPEDSLWAAAERRRPGMSVEDAIAWNQRITETDARACFGGGLR